MLRNNPAPNNPIVINIKPTTIKALEIAFRRELKGTLKMELVI